ncbi:MAG: hypothetical protein NTV99_04710, partial [Deltaproteobacteria bacterium]|nr:hypothetical protein [Deltaproteobacteria bacterium]
CVMDSIVGYIVGGIIFVYFTHLFFKNRAARERFEKAAEELRRAFAPTIAELRGDYIDTGIIKTSFFDESRMRTQHEAMINFRYFLKGENLAGYDDVWNEYYDNGKQAYSIMGRDISSEELLNNINDVLVYTRYGWSLNPVDIWKKIRKKRKLSKNEVKEILDKLYGQDKPNS